MPLLKGPSAVALGGSDEAALAKGVLDALRPFRNVVIRGGAIGGTTIDLDAVTRLATLPPRDVLLGQLAGGFASPLSTMAGLLSAPLRNLGYALSQLRDQRRPPEPTQPDGPSRPARRDTTDRPTDTGGPITWRH